MKEISFITALQARVTAFVITSNNKDANKLIIDLVKELARQEKELNALTAKLRLAERSETHLNISEKFLIEKDDKIAMLKNALDKRDATIKMQNEKIKILEDSRREYAKQLDTANANLILARQQRDAYIQKLQDTVTPETAALIMQENKKLKASLKDLEGTLIARAQHDKELADAVHSVIVANA